uniref:Venom peptide Hta4 n=1 Tax=Hadogenes troglodytes TaxID=1577150 RepID=A0A1B3IJ71_9SCOR|nr:venom peptide Hta4 [Hadogenes troglodytes]
MMSRIILCVLLCQLVQRSFSMKENNDVQALDEDKLDNEDLGDDADDADYSEDDMHLLDAWEELLNEFEDIY